MSDEPRKSENVRSGWLHERYGDSGHLPDERQLERRLCRLEQEFRNFRTAALLVAAIAIVCFLIPQVGAVFVLAWFLMLVVVSVLLLIRLVMWLLERFSDDPL